MNPDSYLRHNREQVYCIVDSETCSVNLAWHENKPWQWSWMLATKDRIISKKNIYVKWPDLQMSKGAAAVNHYDQDLVDSIGISPKAACDQLDALFYDPSLRIIGHNLLGFDIYIHNIHRLCVGKKTDYSYLPRVLDTNYLIKGYKMGLQPRPDENLLVYQMRLTNTRAKGIKTSLKQLCSDYEIDYSQNAHSADADTDMLYQIWKKALHQLEI